MKRTFVSFGILFSITNALFCNSQLAPQAKLVVVLMVKNEAPVICPTLQPYVDAGVDSFLVLDTGSTDNTIAVAEQFFKDHGVQHWVIEQQPFVDFATSRNYALQCAEEKFPDASFMLMPDAEWQLHNVAGLLQFCNEHKADVWDSYLVRIVSPTEDFFTQRLIRTRHGVRFVGVVHEALNQVSCVRVNGDVFFELCRTQYGCEKTEKRWLRDRDLLLKEYERNPHDLRTIFYLAQTCHCLGEWEQARFYYSLRCAIKGWDEEDYVARYRLAQVYEAQNKWAEALDHYLEAYSLRPTRAEPLIRIANYYLLQGKHALSYLFALRAVKIPYPAQELLFIEKDLYEYMRYDILGQCAWYVSEFAIGEAAVRRALLAKPEAPICMATWPCTRKS